MYDLDINGLVEEGVRLARQGRHEDALVIFEKDVCFTMNQTALSYYALSLAMVERRFDKAVSLCVMAAEKEFYNPEIYLNLGRIFLLNGRKATALKAFRKGLKFDESHEELLHEVRRLGVRRKPVIAFLPRDSSLNKFFGILANRLN